MTRRLIMAVDLPDSEANRDATELGDAIIGLSNEPAAADEHATLAWACWLEEMT